MRPAPSPDPGYALGRPPGGRWRHRVALVLTATLTAAAPACRTFDSESATAVPHPAEFAAATTTAPRAATGWLDDIDDPGLTGLVDEAMVYNNDLAASAARLRAARADVRTAAAPLFPQVGVQAEGSRRKSVADSRDDPAVAEIIDSYASNTGIGATLNWEIDLWGRLGDRARAAVADLQAAAADHAAFRLSLAANVARSWFDAAEASLQTQLGRETVDSLQKNLNFVARGVQLGTSQVLDLRLTEANLEAAKSNLEARGRQLDETARALEVLVGRYPSMTIELGGDLPEFDRPVPPGLPSELLLRRPDLVAAERRLAAAAERVSESQKAFLPGFNLTGTAGTSSDELRRLLNPDLLAWSIAASAVQPVFQGGRLRGDLERATARRDEAAAGYRDSALEAFREVETALAAGQFLARQVRAQEKAVSESVAAEDLAWDRYSNGLVDGLTWLEAQRRSFNSKSSLLQIKNLRLQNRIDLYLALGGDFSTRPAPAPAAPAAPGPN